MNYYRCNVCRGEAPWTDQHMYIERPVGKGMKGYEIQFVTCSDKCRGDERTKELFIKWLSRHEGWSRETAKKNYEETIEGKEKEVEPDDED